MFLYYITYLGHLTGCNSDFRPIKSTIEDCLTNKMIKNELNVMTKVRKEAKAHVLVSLATDCILA